MATEQALEIARRALPPGDENRWREMAERIDPDALERWCAQMLAARVSRAAQHASPDPAIPPVEPMPWLGRTFPSGLPVGLFPALITRFEDNLQRIGATLLGVSQRGRTARPADGGWSVQEHAGHLLELERLGEARLAEFERGEPVLSAADMSNRATVQGSYNERPAHEILDALSERRFAMIARLSRLTTEQLAHSALHPRLKQPMNVVDWLYFMCEHDDHHLARMRRLVDAHWAPVPRAQP